MSDKRNPYITTMKVIHGKKGKQVSRSTCIYQAAVPKEPSCVMRERGTPRVSRDDALGSQDQPIRIFKPQTLTKCLHRSHFICTPQN